MSEHSAVAAVTAQTVVQSGVLVKLFALTFALAFAPLTFYYVSRDYFWDGNSTFAAITAVLAANVVLATYIIMSMKEERQAAGDAKSSQHRVELPETKKTQ